MCDRSLTATLSGSGIMKSLSRDELRDLVESALKRDRRCIGGTQRGSIRWSVAMGGLTMLRPPRKRRARADTEVPLRIVPGEMSVGTGATGWMATHCRLLA